MNKSNDLPYTTKREAGCFISVFLILAFVGISILLACSDGILSGICALLLLLILIGLAYCRVILNDPQAPFRKNKKYKV
jgi:hypothetical protein